MRNYYLWQWRRYTQLVKLSRTDEERVFRCQQIRHYRRLFNQSK